MAGFTKTTSLGPDVGRALKTLTIATLLALALPRLADAETRCRSTTMGSTTYTEPEREDALPRQPVRQHGLYELLMSAPLILALGWLAAFALAAHAAVPIPDGFGLAILALTFWSLGIYTGACAGAGRLRAGSTSACSAAPATAPRRPTSSANTTTAIATPMTIATVMHDPRSRGY